MKSFFEGHAMVEEPFLEKDLTSCVLARLDFEYTPIVVQINAKDSVLWQKLQDVLLSYESRLEQLNALMNKRPQG